MKAIVYGAKASVFWSFRFLGLTLTYFFGGLLITWVRATQVFSDTFLDRFDGT